MNNHSDALDSPPVQTKPEAMPLPSSDQWVDLDPDIVNETAKNFSIPKSQEETRSRIALNFTYVFLLLVTLCLLLPFLVNLVVPKTFGDPIGDAKELVTLLASVLGGPFGFIVGFYFKQSQDNINNNG